MGVKEPITRISCDMMDKDGNISGAKTFSTPSKPSIAKWISGFNYGADENIGFLNCGIAKFFTQTYIRIEIDEQITHCLHLPVNAKNLLPSCVYFAVRWSIPVTWVNNSDQFTVPDSGWENDTEFQNDCLVFTLFHPKNKIRSSRGINHWIPFTEKEVNAKNSFSSNFMSAFLKGRVFSPEAQAVYERGLALWRYYHEKIRADKNAACNASIYDIREYFQGRHEEKGEFSAQEETKGRMKSKSGDAEYSSLISALRAGENTLGAKIAEKVYKYGFLPD